MKQSKLKIRFYGYFLTNIGFAVLLDIFWADINVFYFFVLKKRGDPDPEDADCNTSGTIKDEATFEDKLVDIMVLEDPQNMNQALEK